MSYCDSLPDDLDLVSAPVYTACGDSFGLPDDLSSTLECRPAQQCDSPDSGLASVCPPLEDDLHQIIDQAHAHTDLLDDLNDAAFDQIVWQVANLLTMTEQQQQQQQSLVTYCSPLPIDAPLPPLSSLSPSAELVSEEPVLQKPAPVARLIVLSRVNRLLASVARHRQHGVTAEFVVPARTTWSRTRLCCRDGSLQRVDDEAAVGSTVREDSSVRRFTLTVLLLEKIKQLLETDTYSTKRDLFYQNVSLFGNQRALDTVLDDVTRLLQIPRHMSHVRATSKGLLSGSLVLQADDVMIDCSAAKSGVLVPHSPETVQVISSEAQYILVIEKDATFQKILDSDFFKYAPPGIILTGKGFPDLNTRVLLRRLVQLLLIPALALVDADPHGLEIFCVYKFGSRNMAHEWELMACPQLQMIGIFPTDISELQLPEHALVAMTTADYAKARCMMSRPYISTHPDLQRQLEALQAATHKAEIQSLTGLRAHFLTDTYLPSRLRSVLSNTKCQVPTPHC